MGNLPDGSWIKCERHLPHSHPKSNYSSQILFLIKYIVLFVSQTQPGLFDPRLSSTSSLLMCSDIRCQTLVRDRSAVCNTSTNSCGYIMNYGPGSNVLSSTAGYFLSDMVYLDILNGSQQTSSYPVPIIFG